MVGHPRGTIQGVEGDDFDENQTVDSQDDVTGAQRVLANDDRESPSVNEEPSPQPEKHARQRSTISSGPRSKQNNGTDHYRRTAEILPDFVELLGEPPAKVDTYTGVLQELGLLKRATRQEEIDKWSWLPHGVQICLACLVAARIRHLQSEIEASLAGLVTWNRPVRSWSRPR